MDTPSFGLDGLRGRRYGHGATGPWGPTDTFPDDGCARGKKLGASLPRAAASCAASTRSRAGDGAKRLLGREDFPPWRGSGRLLGAARAAGWHSTRAGSFLDRRDKRMKQGIGQQGFYLGVVLRGWRGGSLFVLPGFRHLDLLAQFARVLPVEGLLDGYGDAAGALRVVVEHLRPGDGLQDGPVAARNREECERRESEAEFPEHGMEITTELTPQASRQWKIR